MKLLNKSIGLYILYASVLLLIAIPILYFAIERRVVNEVDESLIEQKHKFISKLENTNEAGLLQWLQNIEPDVTIMPVTDANNKQDKFYTIIVFDKIINEKSPYRILESNIILKGKSYNIQLKSSLIDSEDLIESIVKTVCILLLLMIAGLALINQVLSKKIWKPFYSTITKLNEFKIEKNEALQFEKTGITEFTDLNNAIVTLTNRNLETYQSQKEFTENASHEMQTPLAVLQGKVDLLMQTNPLSKEQSELIGDLADVNQRMSRLNKTLLLLTKIENNQFSETENISIKEVLKKLIVQYSFQAEQKGINLQQNFTTDIEITGNKMLIEIMLGNFLSNAIKHNKTNGSVIINGDNNSIYFINTANTAALDKEKIFQRFHKQTADNNSLGLGLQIAKKIAGLYDYTINYEFKNEQHLFTLAF